MLEKFEKHLTNVSCEISLSKNRYEIGSNQLHSVSTRDVNKNLSGSFRRHFRYLYCKSQLERWYDCFIDSQCKDILGNQ